MPELDAFKREDEGLRILRKRPRRAPMQRAGELIKDEDERESRSWPVRPGVEFTPRRSS